MKKWVFYKKKDYYILVEILTKYFSEIFYQTKSFYFYVLC